MTDIIFYPAGSSEKRKVSKLVIVELKDHAFEGSNLMLEFTFDDGTIWHDIFVKSKKDATDR